VSKICENGRMNGIGLNASSVSKRREAAEALT